MLTLFKAIESVKMGLKRVKKKIGREKIGPRLGKKIDRLEVYTRLITMRSKPNCFAVAFLLSLFLSCVADIFILSCCSCCFVLN